MSFRTRASIDANSHKGIIVQNANGMGGTLIPTGRELTNSITQDVAIVDGTGNQITSFGGSTTPSTIYNGKTTVTTAGTRVALASTQAITSVVVKALAANTGIIYVGNVTVASTNGFALAAGDSVALDIANLATVYLDSSTNTQSVTYIAS